MQIRVTPLYLPETVKSNGFLQKPLQLLPIANGVDEPNGSLLIRPLNAKQLKRKR